MKRYIVYFTPRAPDTNRVGGRVSDTGCVCGDCYLCPLQSCARINGDVRAVATPDALKWLQERRKKALTIKYIGEKEETESKWRL